MKTMNLIRGKAPAIAVALLSVFGFLFSSCNDSYLDEKQTPGNTGLTADYELIFNKIDGKDANQLKTRSIGDGAYDVLGYGYNSFDGLMDNPQGVKAKIIDFDRLLSGKGIDPLTGKEVELVPGKIHSAELPGHIKEYERYDSDIDRFVMGASAEASFSLDSINLSFSHFPKIPSIPIPGISIPGTGISLPETNIDIVGMISDVANILPWGANSFYVKGAFGIDHGTKKSYHQTNVLLEKKRIFFEDISFLKYFLTPSFRLALKEMSGEDILRSYGTHVLTDIELGSKLSATVSAYQKRVNDSLLVKFGANLFDVLQGKMGLNLSVYRDLTNITIEISQFGGGDAKYYPPINPGSEEMISPEIFDWEAWQKGVTQENSVLILADTQDALPLLSLVDDPAVKAKIKKAILLRASELEKNKKKIRSYYLDEELDSRYQIPTGFIKNARRYDAFSYVNFKGGFSNGLMAGPGTYGLGFIYPHVIDNTLPVSLRIDYFKANTNEITGKVSLLSTNLQKFLCRDGLFRTVKEDKEGLRFWTPIYKYEGENDF